jgi:hypothetical protein
MKKILALILLLSAVTIVFCACDDASEQIPDNISYAEIDIFWGGGDDFFVEVVRGFKENPLNADGKSTNVLEFFEIKITPLKSTSAKTLNFELSGENFNMSGIANLSPTENQFVFLSKEKVKFEELTDILIVSGQKQQNVELYDMTADNLNWKNALEISQAEFKERIDGASRREIFIKMTRDRQNIGGDCFWYVCYIGEANDFWSLLLDAQTGKVIAKK